MNLSEYTLGKTKGGETVKAFELENKNGMKVTVLNYGCTVTKIEMPDKTGKVTDVCLGYNTVEEYEENDGYLGAVVGRYANRIRNGEFELNGEKYTLAVNNGPNHLHGGNKGFDKYIWKPSLSEVGLQFSRISLDKEEGYPGNLKVSVTYNLSDANELYIIYNAVSDQDTPINLTNHAYFNLDGEQSGDILGHTIQILGSRFLENDENCLPTGEILPVDGTAFDFRAGKKIGLDINKNEVQLINGKGYDHNWILDSESYLKKAAVLTGEKSGIQMTVFTTQPGMQFYSGNFLTDRKGKQSDYKFRSGLCLETQHFPDSVTHKHFPDVILKKGEKYNQTTVYKFEV